MSGAAKRRVERAIILAAGRGSRLDRGDALPKPLRPVAGVPLIGRILRTLASEGIREAVVVVGYEGDRIQAALADEALHAGVTVHFVENALWERSNGLSLLAAREFLDRECLLTMADHLVAPALLRRLVRAEIPAGACALGVDFDIERCFDLDDATKVLVEAGSHRGHQQGARRLQRHRHGHLPGEQRPG
jgi:choline kinase